MIINNKRFDVTSTTNRTSMNNYINEYSYGVNVYYQIEKCIGDAARECRAPGGI